MDQKLLSKIETCEHSANFSIKRQTKRTNLPCTCLWRTSSIIPRTLLSMLFSIVHSQHAIWPSCWVVVRPAIHHIFQILVNTRAITMWKVGIWGILNTKHHKEDSCKILNDSCCGVFVNDCNVQNTIYNYCACMQMHLCQNLNVYPDVQRKDIAIEDQQKTENLAATDTDFKHWNASFPQ